MSSAHGKLAVSPTESETTCTVGNFPRGSREAPETSVSQEADRSEKARRRKSDVHVSGESDSSIVPKKRTNKGGSILRAHPPSNDIRPTNSLRGKRTRDRRISLEDSQNETASSLDTVSAE